MNMCSGISYRKRLRTAKMTDRNWSGNNFPDSVSSHAVWKKSKFLMLTPQDIDRIKKGIIDATSSADIKRLENALSSGSIESVRDLIPDVQNQLASLWAESKQDSLVSAAKAVKPMQPTEQTRKTPRQIVEEEQAKRRFTESAHLMGIILNEIVPKLPKGLSQPRPGYQPAPDHVEGMKRLLAIECGVGLCRSQGGEFSNHIIRMVVSDFLADRTIFDFDISVPKGLDVVDSRPSQTGKQDYSPDGTIPMSEARKKLFELMSKETAIICYNKSRCADALELSHTNWLSLQDIIAVDPSKKKNAEGRFYIRSALTPTQLVEGFMGEMIYDRFKHVPLRDRMLELNLAFIRLLKAVARRKPITFPVLMDPPRRPQTMYLSHIPSNWTDEEIKMVLPTASEVEPVEFAYDIPTNEWRGECHVSFPSDKALNDAFARLTACTDIFVGWEWRDCGKVNEEVLRNLASDFGPVVGVRIQEKYLETPRVLPGKEQSRPFGFVSMARYQDALAMAQDPRQIVKDDISYHVKISKKPITSFKRVPLGYGEDYIEGFIM